MSHWTGGQYSVYRVGLALGVALHAPWLASALALPLALGFADRLAALGLAALAWLSAGHAAIPALLVLHACTPGRPYGAWSARGRPDPGGGWRMPPWHPFAWVGPGWIPPKRDFVPARLFYDGDCGLCHRAVRFVLAEDPDGRSFRFAPLANAAFEEAVPAAERATLPDSLVVRTPEGRTLVRSDAVREIAERLGGLWRVLGLASRAIPTRWLDRAYDRIAALRKRLFARPADACPLVPAELRARFD